MKKTIIKITLSSLCALAMVTPITANAAQKTDIRYAIWDREQLPAVEKIIEKFEAKNPDINVVVEFTPWEQYWIKLSAAASGGVAADVYWMSMEGFKTYADNGLLEPIDSYLEKSTVDLSAYPEYATSTYQTNGKKYGIPRDVDAIGVWYNKDLFDKAGVEYPKAGWTWEDMVSKAKKIKNKTDDFIFPIMMDLDEGQTSYFNFIVQSGSDIVSKNKKSIDISGPKTIAAYRKVQDLMSKGYMASAQQISELTADETFQAGRVAMAYSGSWVALPFAENPDINSHIGVVEMPSINRSGGVSHSIGYVMSAKSEHKEQSWRFMEYLGTDEAQIILGSSRTVIPAKLNTIDSWFNAFSNVDVSPFKDALAKAHALPTAGNTARWYAILADGMKRIWLGQDPEKVMPAINKRIQRIIDKG